MVTTNLIASFCGITCCALNLIELCACAVTCFIFTIKSFNDGDNDVAVVVGAILTRAPGRSGTRPVRGRRARRRRSDRGAARAATRCGGDAPGRRCPLRRRSSCAGHFVSNPTDASSSWVAAIDSRSARSIFGGCSDASVGRSAAGATPARSGYSNVVVAK